MDTLFTTGSVAAVEAKERQFDQQSLINSLSKDFPDTLSAIQTDGKIDDNKLLSKIKNLDEDLQSKLTMLASMSPDDPRRAGLEASVGSLEQQLLLLYALAI